MRPGVRKALLHQDRSVAAWLTYYAPGLRQAAHVHDRAQVSVLLAGSLRETVRGTDALAMNRASGVKPGGVRHAAEFGPQGALMLSLDVLDDAAAPARPACDWRPTPEAVHGLVGLLLDGVGPATRAETVGELLALLGGGAPEDRGAPAACVRALKAALDDDPAAVRLEAAAREAGVHRVHLSRSFVAAYGVSASQYRARAMAARAVSAALEGEATLAGVAAEAGFADQSHLARTFRREVGAPLSRVAALLRQVTSVQAAPAAGA